MQKYYIDEIYGEIIRLTIDDGKTIAEEYWSVAELNKAFPDLLPQECFEGLSWVREKEQLVFRERRTIRRITEGELHRVLTLQRELFGDDAQNGS